MSCRRRASEVRRGVSSGGTLVAVCLLGVICFCHAGSEIYHDNYVYKLDDGELTFAGTCEFIDTRQHVIINGEIEGHPVVGIGTLAFKDFPLLQSISMPESIRVIGEQAFYYANSLSTIVISSQVVDIGRGAFANCTNLQTIVVSEQNPIYSSMDGVLFDKQKTTLLQYPGGKAGHYVIPASVTNVTESAFAVSPFLVSVTISSNVVAVGDYTFRRCENMSAVNMGGGLVSIGKQAFADCNSLTEIHVPTGVAVIGHGAFSCVSITNYSVAASNSHFKTVNGVLFSADDTILMQYPSALPGAEYVIPTNVTEVSGRAFFGSTALTNIIMSSGITMFGEWAFAECASITSVNIPDSVTTIGEASFAGCMALSTLIIPDSVHTLGNIAFSSCANLTSVTIGNSLAEIGDYAFFDCTSLIGVYFRGDAPTLGTNVFFNATPTVYYLQGASGFGATFGGRPTAVWTP